VDRSIYKGEVMDMKIEFAEYDGPPYHIAVLKDGEEVAYLTPKDPDFLGLWEITTPPGDERMTTCNCLGDALTLVMEKLSEGKL